MTNKTREPDSLSQASEDGRRSGSIGSTRTSEGNIRPEIDIEQDQNERISTDINHEQEGPRKSVDHQRSLSGSTDNLLGPITAPKDKYRLVCIGFTILGITTLLPWNFFITATDYWMYKFRDVSSDYDAEKPHDIERTPLQTFFESYLAIAANLPMLLSMVLNSLYGQRFSQKKRLYLSLSVMLVVFAITTIMARIDTDHMQDIFFGITIAMVVVISFFSAIFQASIFGIVASFPSNCMYAMVTGQAVAGILAVALQTLSMLNNTEPLMSGLWYFLVSTIFLAFAIICYWSMDNDYTRYYLMKIPDEDQLSTSLSVNLIEKKTEIFETMKDSWQMGASVIFAFWGSLAVFPGVCVLVKPQYPNTSVFTGRFFTTITSFLLFNCGDLAGRMCSAFLPFPPNKKNALFICSLAKVIIPMMILFCNVYPRHNTSVWFTNDIYFPIFVGMTGLTNGYIFSSSMVMASVNSERDRLELTGFVMASALGIGLTLGSVSSTILLRII